MCDRCVRPLCRKCKTKGALSRCAECIRAGERDRGPGDFAPSSGSYGIGKQVVLALALLLGVVLFVYSPACAPLPNITWLK